MYKVLDLFAGCGGISQGFEKAGFNIIAANEINKTACETYSFNHKKTKLIKGDVTDNEIKNEIISFSKKNKCDIIVGGPPCQAYSVAGLRKPNDPRGKLFEDYLEIVNKVKPKLFIIENVKGLLSIETEKDNLDEDQLKKIKKLEDLEDLKIKLLKLRKQARNSDNFEFNTIDEKNLYETKEEIKSLKIEIKELREKLIDKIKRRFEKIGYITDFKVLNSADYGVPQTRERVILIGVKKSLNKKIIFPIETHSKNQKNNLKKWITVKEAISDLEKKKEDIKFNHIFMKHKSEFIEKIKKTPQGKSVLNNYNNAFFRNPENEPSRTVKENHGAVLVHYKKNRTMTPRELARLQSFSDEFIFCGSKKEILVQIGNAIPPKLGEALAKNCIKILN